MSEKMMKCPACFNESLEVIYALAFVPPDSLSYFCTIKECGFRIGAPIWYGATAVWAKRLVAEAQKSDLPPIEFPCPTPSTPATSNS